jgi:DNA-directed RNA polymerase II subunit RPB1
MNMHVPQSQESDAELRNLAAVPYQIISPANNSSIIGIYQDSLLGAYQFTREDIRFDTRTAMNLLMANKNINIPELQTAIKKNKGYISNFDILSQIMPPLSLKYKTKSFKEERDDMATSNSVLEIMNGKYIRGQLDKSTLGGRSKGLLQRICNDFGNFASAKFIDDFQNIITEYMKSSAFSVGISDLISDKKTNDEIVHVISSKKQDVKNIIDQVQLGIFENNTGKTNQEEFETRVNSVLNQATSESGKIGLKSLNKNNRFVTMVNAGSKGSDLNISFMISCLGQQNVDGKRIPYGFEHRTLPHFTKYNDSPEARGFVDSSYIQGLNPQEFFFHAMGGRMGLIDTAVKTSETGYIQRRLIKALEDLKVEYDMTIRNNKNKIVQFCYGDDSMDTTKVEIQSIPIVNMSTQDIYSHFSAPEDIGKDIVLHLFMKNVATRNKKQLDTYKTKILPKIKWMIEMRDLIIKNVFKYKTENSVNCPVAFSYIIQNIQKQCHIQNNGLVDITLLEALEMIEQCYSNLQKLVYSPPSELFHVLYTYYLSPKELLYVKRYNKSALTLLLSSITLYYKKAIINPGEMVGIIAGQSIGEISTQLTLNTFHLAGVSTKSNVTRGVPRIEEILSTSSEIKNPSLSIYLKHEDETQKEKALKYMYMLEHTKLKDIVLNTEICFDPDDLNTLIEHDKELILQYKEFETIASECAGLTLEENNERSKWIIRIEMDSEVMLEKNITMEDVNFTLKSCYENQIHCIYSDFNSDKLIFRIRMNDFMKNNSKNKKKVLSSLDQSDQIYALKNFQDELLENIVLRGIKGINKIILRKIIDNMIEKNGIYQKQDIWVLDTIGTNLLDVLALDFIDNTRTVSNDIIEIYNVLGIEAARQSLYNEMVDVLEFDGTYIDYHNYSVLIDRMTYTEKIIPIVRHGINNDNIGPIAKASFEETPEMFLKAARHGELDTLKGVSANVMCGQEGFYGTTSFQVLIDSAEYMKIDEVQEVEPQINVEQKLYSVADNVCSIANINIPTNVANIATKDLGYENEYNPGF